MKSKKIVTLGLVLGLVFVLGFGMQQGGLISRTFAYCNPDWLPQLQFEGFSVANVTNPLATTTTFTISGIAVSCNGIIPGPVGWQFSVPGEPMQSGRLGFGDDGGVYQGTVSITNLPAGENTATARLQDADTQPPFITKTAQFSVPQHVVPPPSVGTVNVITKNSVTGGSASAAWDVFNSNKGDMGQQSTYTNVPAAAGYQDVMVSASGNNHYAMDQSANGGICGAYNGPVSIPGDCGAPSLPMVKNGDIDNYVLLLDPIAVLTVQGSPVQLNGQIGGPNPTSNGVLISNTGAPGSILMFSSSIQITSGPAGWLSMSPQNGTLSSGGSNSPNITANMGKFTTPGTYTGTITITPGSQPDGQNAGSAQVINVSIVVTKGNTPPTKYTLNVSNSGGGKITSADGGINCGSTCSETLTAGTQVTLTETPASGYTFDGWGGPCSNTVSSCSFTMTQSWNVTANFGQGGGGNQKFTLSVTNNGGGTVSGSGINCGSTCSETLSKGTVVNLTAAPNSNYTFKGWGGACSGTGSCSFTMSQSQNVTATFKANSVGNNNPVTVYVNPTTASVQVNGGTDQFIGTVLYDSQKEGVTWSLSGSNCNGSACGILSSPSSTSGNPITYTAPPNLPPSSPTVILTATSIASSSVYAYATITLTPANGPPPPPPPPPPSCQLSADPTTVVVPLSSNLTYSCTNVTSCNPITNSADTSTVQVVVNNMNDTANGTDIVYPTVNTTYTLACQDTNSNNQSVNGIFTTQINVGGPGSGECNPANGACPN